MLAGGVGRSWHDVRAAGLPASITGLASLTCPTSGHCLAVGAQVAVTTDGGEHWTASGPLPAPPTGYTAGDLGQAACRSSGQCLVLEDLSPTSSSGAVSTRVLTNSP